MNYPSYWSPLSNQYSAYQEIGGDEESMYPSDEGDVPKK